MSTHTDFDWTMQDRLQKTLDVLHLSHEQMGAELGYSRNRIGDFIAGRATPRRTVLIAWAMRCGVSVEWLETGEWPDDSGDTPDDLGFGDSRWGMESPACGVAVLDLYRAEKVGASLAPTG